MLNAVKCNLRRASIFIRWSAVYQGSAGALSSVGRGGGGRGLMVGLWGLPTMEVFLCVGRWRNSVESPWHPGCSSYIQFDAAWCRRKLYFFPLFLHMKLNIAARQKNIIFILHSLFVDSGSICWHKTLRCLLEIKWLNFVYFQVTLKN